MQPLMLDVSARYGYPCRYFLPNMSTTICFREEQIKNYVDMADLIAFGGGQDIGTEMYGHRSVVGGVPYEMSDRDKFELLVFEEALKQEKPILGICRGAQFLCALSGGALVQDVNNHTTSHAISTIDDTKGLGITSTHHQMMYLNNLQPDVDYHLLAWTKLSDWYRRDERLAPIEPSLDPEVVYFIQTRSFAIQGHPEYMRQGDPVVVWLQNKFYSIFPELK